MQKKIKSALISVFYKDGILPIALKMQEAGITIYSTGGTRSYLEEGGVKCVPVEQLTTYPSILGGRVKTLHPIVFGGILGRRDNETDLKEMEQYHIPEIDLVIVDLYPFEETLKNTSEEPKIIEKIDIGGPSMIRAAAKNFKDVIVVADKEDYSKIDTILTNQNASTSIEERKAFAAKAFQVVMNYDIAINNYFNPDNTVFQSSKTKYPMRYGENPHQQGAFLGDMEEVFNKLHGKELSYNNIVDVDAALNLIREFPAQEGPYGCTFAVIKHTNVCGIAQRETVSEAWKAALAGDSESAFGGILVTNRPIDAVTAEEISNIFFEVLIAPAFTEDAMPFLFKKKNRIILKLKPDYQPQVYTRRTLLNGILIQQPDLENYKEWKEVGGRQTTQAEKEELIFANIVCKHLKSNAIALIKNRQLVGKGCGQTSRVDALRQSIAKAEQFQFDLNGSVMASDAFFPFGDCVEIAHKAGVKAIIQPGGSIRDAESIEYCEKNNLAMVITGVRHFRH